MIEGFHLLRNVGQFDSVTSSGLNLAKLTLIYGENGRGKTTLAAILRSLGSNDASPINERQRLGTTHPPHIVLQKDGAQTVFTNGTWSRAPHNVVIFDDVFVAENICSGLAIESSHRQNLHELIIGPEGVALIRAMQEQLGKVEQRNKTLKSYDTQIPAHFRGTRTVQQFCALKINPSIEPLIEEAEKQLTAAKASTEIAQQPMLRGLSLPAFDLEHIEALLSSSISDLEKTALDRLNQHFDSLGPTGERWVREGYSTFHRHVDENETCPFCAQGIASLPLISQYRQYFSEAYNAHQRQISESKETVAAAHDSSVMTAFERDVRRLVEAHSFWSKFVRLERFSVDTADVVRAWQAAREAVLQRIAHKQSSPLEPMHLPSDAVAKIEAYHRSKTEAERLAQELVASNDELEALKEAAANNSVASLESSLADLKIMKLRGLPEIDLKCQEYLAEVKAKKEAEKARDDVRAELDLYRQAIFSQYGLTINKYLTRLSAGFHIGSVAPTNHRGGSSAVYNVVINDSPVDLAANDGVAFRSTLSAGDRNTLALAFFFSSLEHNKALNSTVVVIDDPMTSLDEHRTRNTMNEIVGLVDKSEQVIVLSHSRSFLCRIWEKAHRRVPCALRLLRSDQGSLLAAWDVTSDSLTDHDRNYELVSGYIQTSDPQKERSVAGALRPMLESYLRVTYPEHFPPGTLLGNFIQRCRTSLASGRIILSDPDITNLDEMKDYANQFHHDTSAGWETIYINDGELLDHCRRVLNFIRRPI